MLTAITITTTTCIITDCQKEVKEVSPRLPMTGCGPHDGHLGVTTAIAVASVLWKLISATVALKENISFSNVLLLFLYWQTPFWQVLSHYIFLLFTLYASKSLFFTHLR